MNTAGLLVAGGLLVAAFRAAAAADSLPGPIFSGLGTLQHPVSTSSPRAQRYFDQGMRLLFGFNHREAIRSFRSAAAVDPECAMAYWGVAYAYGPHVNKPMDAEDVAGAWDALSEAVARRSGATPLEQEYIAALEQRYRKEFTPDRSELDRAFADAMRNLVDQRRNQRPATFQPRRQRGGLSPR